ncbi:hypothetical protein [Streptosporangium sp. KLBMP 9127]|nr:hypothetical protein [Streptosporangium sp. KLBMP 9127]
MLVANISYDYGLDGGERVKGGSLWTERKSETKQPTFNGSQISCDLENVDSIILNDGRAVKVFWDKEVFGVGGDPTLLLRGHRDVALISTFEGQTLVARAEPTEDGRIGIAIENENGKALFVGMGDLIEIDHPAKFQLLADFSHVYQWRRSSPSSCAHTHGSIRVTPTTPGHGVGGPAVPDGGPRDAGPQ